MNDGLNVFFDLYYMLMYQSVVKDVSLWFITQWDKTMLWSLVLHFFGAEKSSPGNIFIQSFFSDYLWCNINTWLLISVFQLAFCLEQEVFFKKSCTVISFWVIHGNLNNDKLHIPILSIASFMMLCIRVLSCFHDQTTIWLSLSSSPWAIALIN